MIKMLLGALIMVGLVGYGVITTDHIEEAGERVKNGVNNAATWVKDNTER
jgi:hypothetical protein